MTNKPRNWKPFQMTTPTPQKGAITIDPRPNNSAIKTAKLLGRGAGELKAHDRVES